MIVDHGTPLSAQTALGVSSIISANLHLAVTSEDEGRYWRGKRETLATALVEALGTYQEVWRLPLVIPSEPLPTKKAFNVLLFTYDVKFLSPALEEARMPDASWQITSSFQTIGIRTHRDGNDMRDAEKLAKKLRIRRLTAYEVLMWVTAYPSMVTDANTLVFLIGDRLKPFNKDGRDDEDYLCAERRKDGVYLVIYPIGARPARSTYVFALHN